MLIEEDEGRGGHAIFYKDGEFIVLGGEDNTFKNWMKIKENSRKSQMTVAGIDEAKKRSSSIQPTLSGTSTMGAGFNLAGNRGGKKAQKIMDTYLVFNIGKNCNQ